MSKSQGSIFDALIGQTRDHGATSHSGCKACAARHGQSSPDLEQLQDQAIAMMQNAENLMPLLSGAPPEVRDSLRKALDVARQSISRRRP